MSLGFLYHAASLFASGVADNNADTNATALVVVPTGASTPAQCEQNETLHTDANYHIFQVDMSFRSVMLISWALFWTLAFVVCRCRAPGLRKLLKRLEVVRVATGADLIRKGSLNHFIPRHTEPVIGAVIPLKLPAKFRMSRTDQCLTHVTLALAGSTGFYFACSNVVISLFFAFSEIVIDEDIRVHVKQTLNERIYSWGTGHTTAYIMGTVTGFFSQFIWESRWKLAFIGAGWVCTFIYGLCSCCRNGRRLNSLERSDANKDRIIADLLAEKRAAEISKFLRRTPSSIERGYLSELTRLNSAAADMAYTRPAGVSDEEARNQSADALTRQLSAKRMNAIRPLQRMISKNRVQVAGFKGEGRVRDANAQDTWRVPLSEALPWLRMQPSAPPAAAVAREEA